MNMLPLTRRPYDSRFGVGTRLTTALTIVGIALVVAFVALQFGGSSRTTPKSAISHGYTLIHFFGTGAPPVVRENSTAPHTNTPHSQHFYGLQP